MLRHLKGYAAGCDIVIYAHTHKPRIHTDAKGRLLVNPGETSGWTYRLPTIAMVETTTRTGRIIDLPPLPPMPDLPPEVYSLPRPSDSDSTY
jgi:predicted phosphodiesterase